MPKCKGCQAEIIWIKTVNGKNMPCNAEKTTIVTEGGETIVGHIPHWSTCPQLLSGKEREMSKEKQIEEMRKALSDAEKQWQEFCRGRRCQDCEYYFAKTDCKNQFLAEHLTNNAERKQSYGVWVLHKPRQKNRNATYKCSVCGKLCSSYYNDVGEWQLCPHCGAKMRKEDEGK